MGCEEDNNEWLDLEEAEYQTKCIYVVSDRPCGEDSDECRAAASLPANLKYMEKNGQVSVLATESNIVPFCCTL